MSKEEQKKDQVERESVDIEEQPSDFESAEKEFSLAEILENTKRIADEIELSVDNALEILQNGKQKGIFGRAIDRLRNVFRTKLDESAALEDITSVRSRLVELYSNEEIDFSAEDLDTNSELMVQLDRIETKLKELQEGSKKEGEEGEALEENIYEHSERQITQEIDEEFDLNELRAARDELFEDLLKKDSELRIAIEASDEESQKKLLEEYDEIRDVYNEVKELISSMERIRKLIIRAETIRLAYETTKDTAATKDELTEILHEIDMLDGEADFKVPDSIEDALSEQTRAVEGLKDALKKLMEKTEGYFDEEEIELHEDEHVEYEEVDVEGGEGEADLELKGSYVGPRDAEDARHLENIMSKLANLQVGDIIISTSGTRRRLLAINGERVLIERTDTTGYVSKQEWDLDSLQNPSNPYNVVDVVKSQESNVEEVDTETEGGVEKEKTELDQVRYEYLKALEKEGGIVSKKRFLGIFGRRKKEKQKFEEIEKRYKEALKAEHQKKLDAKKEELREALENDGDIPEYLFDEYLKLLDAEETKIDEFVTSAEEKTKFQRFKQFWRRTSKKRLLAGLAIAGVGIGAGGVVAAGATVAGAGILGANAIMGASAVTAFFGSAGFMAARGLVSGGGTFMAAEAAMDVGSKKLGQRGIIDDETKIGAGRSIKEVLANLPFRKGKGLYESQKEIDRVLEVAENGDNVFEKYTIDQLRAELTRLRALSIDKGVEIGEAGRLGGMHAELIALVRKTYHKKLREEFNIGEEQESDEERKQRLADSTLEQIAAGELDFSDIEKANDEELIKRLQGVEKIVDSDGAEHNKDELIKLIGDAVNPDVESVSIDDVPDIGGLRGALQRMVEDYNRAETEADAEDVDLENKFAALIDISDREVEINNDEVVSQIQTDRRKKIARGAIAGGLALASGIIIGSGTAGRLIRGVTDKMHGVGEVVTTAETTDLSGAETAPTDEPSAIDRLFGKIGFKVKDAVAPGDSSSVDSTDLPTQESGETSTQESGEGILDRVKGFQDKAENFVSDLFNRDDSPAETTPDAGEQGQAEGEESLGSQTSETETKGTPDSGTKPSTPEDAPKSTEKPTTGEAGTEGTSKPATSEAGDTPTREPAPTTETSAENVSRVIEVSKGDTIWSIAKQGLISRIGEEEWAELGEAKQTYMIDAIKDVIAADPDAYITDGTLDKLIPGETTVDIGKAFEGAGLLEEIQEAAENLSPEQAQNIIDNNEAIAQAAKAGIEISSENVDQVAAEVRGYGLDYLDDSGEIHEWTTGEFPVDRVGEDFVNATTGEKLTPEELNSVTNKAGEKAIEAGTDSGASTENSGVFSDSALRSILESNNPAAIEEYLHDFMSSKDWSESKIAVFLTSLRDDTGAIHNNIGGFNDGTVEFDNDTLDGLMLQWESHALIESFDDLKNMDPGEWIAIKISEDEYAFVQKPVGEDYYLIDEDANLKTEGASSLSEDQMKVAFKNGSLDGIKGLNDGVYGAEPEAEPEVDKKPQASTEVNEKPTQPEVEEEPQPQAEEEPQFKTESQPEEKPQASSKPDEEQKFAPADTNEDGKLDKEELKAAWEKSIARAEGLTADTADFRGELRAGIISGEMSADEFIAKAKEFQIGPMNEEAEALLRKRFEMITSILEADQSKISSLSVTRNMESIVEVLRENRHNALLGGLESAQPDSLETPMESGSDSQPEAAIEPAPEAENPLEDIMVSLPERESAFLGEHGLRYENGKLFGLTNLENGVYDFAANLGPDQKPELIHFLVRNNGLQITLTGENVEYLDEQWVTPEGEIFEGSAFSEENRPRGKSFEPEIQAQESTPESELEANNNNLRAAEAELRSGKISPEGLATDWINRLRPDLTFKFDDILTADAEHLSDIKSVSETLRNHADTMGYTDISKVYSELNKIIDAQLENLNNRQAA